MKEKYIGFRIDEIGRLIRKAVGKKQIQNGTDPMVLKRCWIMGYIMTNDDKVICQKDLECIFHMPKSSITDTLTILENEGLLDRVSIEGDGRKKRIVITDKGREFNKTMEATIADVEAYAIKNISGEELEVFYRVLGKMKENIILYEETLKEE